MRNFSLVPSMNARQSSLLTALKIPFVALSITISIPLNVSWMVWLNRSRSSLFKISQWRIEIPAEFGGINSDFFMIPLVVFPFTSITWQLCLEDSCSANSWESLVSPLVIYQQNKLMRKWKSLFSHKIEIAFE